jgi:hypothetical protein
MDISDKDLGGVNLDPTALLYESSLSPSHFLDALQHQSDYPVMDDSDSTSLVKFLIAVNSIYEFRLVNDNLLA